MATNCTDYQFTKIEKHWQKYWADHATFKASDDSDKPKYYLLDMFPYPSGAGLHAGHVENFAASDILGRFKFAQQYNVLHPMGWDAFGLPAEQYAVKTGTHPSITTKENIENFKRQLTQLGFALDWDREISTTDPQYYKWTQWIFLQLFKRGLAYVDERPVNWCPALGTVLANEEVVEGKSEVGGHPVERRNLRQWVLRITAYADKLIEGLDSVDWPDSTKSMQKNWIGKSTGAEVDFELENDLGKLTVYTTRPDTLFGATYMVISPEHPLVDALTTDDKNSEVATYVQEASHKSDLDRTELNKNKTGVFTGSYAINPVNGERIPVWIADYVLMSYGTGAIMAVPGHDERDFEFATKFDIPIPRVVTHESGDEAADLPFCDPGISVNSGEFSGLPTAEAKKKIISWLEEKKLGKGAINYKLRDWLFSRQRYWGEPFPIIWISGDAYAQLQETEGALKDSLPQEPVTFEEDGKVQFAVSLPESALPLTLPETDNYKPSGNGESPLATIDSWVDVWINLETGEAIPGTEAKPEGDHWVSARRETNTMPQWAGSCWYYLRYIDPNNEEALIDPKLSEYWGVPDFYMGGAEHAVLHLLYARFWHHFLVDIGVLKQPEPFSRLFHQGIILGEDGEKMSKSRGNTISPDDFIQTHGADSLRTYIMFMGPLEDMKPWNSQGIEGVFRFLKKVWREFIDADGKPSAKLMSDGEESPENLKLLHATIKKVTEDLENIRFNTAVSQMMIFMNHVTKVDALQVDSAKKFIQLLAPFAPHLAEELWSRFGEEPSVALAPWPSYDESLLVSNEVQIGLLVNGKPRGEATVSKEATEEEVLELAKSQDKVSAQLEGKTIRKVIYVPGKIINIVTN